jgi:hypothetical protein
MLDCGRCCASRRGGVCRWLRLNAFSNVFAAAAFVLAEVVSVLTVEASPRAVPGLVTAARAAWAAAAALLIYVTASDPGVIARAPGAPPRGSGKAPPDAAAPTPPSDMPPGAKVRVSDVM